MRTFLLVGTAVAVLVTGGCTLPASTSEPSQAPAGLLTVPDVAGKRLPQARADLEGLGLGNIATIDATGKGRVVIEANNWLVKAQHPAAGAKVGRAEKVTLDVSKPTDGIGPASVSKGIMPDVKCMELQAAQDTLQEAGFFLLASKDALGDRQQILDRDWVVIGQSTESGQLTLPLKKITLTVVKYGEPTGDSGCQS